MAETTVTAYLRKLLDDTDETMFSDDELETLMSLHRVHVLYEWMEYDAEQKRFWVPGCRCMSEASLWDSYDEDDQNELTPDSYSLMEGWFEFDTEQDVPVYLKAVRYEIEAAAAAGWTIIASDKAKLTQYMSGSGAESAQQAHAQALKQVQLFMGRANSPGSGTTPRLYE